MFSGSTCKLKGKTMNVYIGLDLSHKSVAMCVVDLKCGIVGEVNLLCAAEPISALTRAPGSAQGRRSPLIVLGGNL